jgi:hypothetical protein
MIETERQTDDEEYAEYIVTLSRYLYLFNGAIRYRDVQIDVECVHASIRM